MTVRSVSYVSRGKNKRIKLSRLNFILFYFQKGLNYINDGYVFEFSLAELTMCEGLGNEMLA